ncbi:hypothetical protein [Pseudoxanthomonas winnipegensis]|uniref:Uncharacterized protein n=1 Tax=Pseudoxanthomonas winnipegensis TaxID=2480810 RepID=A0A4Q8L9X8_9GAMM|nr:hypothetical protein [Pseudoxanthomonas winnipegensis]RZZ81436.1 hypothetical protein EA663_20660 [Pseudoxanthomonas winnipegensis]TAA25432.1 hypothetical protein EA660_08205 [Pseudoxanthomonas winnipegensis]
MSTDIVKALRDEAEWRRTPGHFLPLQNKVLADLLESAAKEIEHQRQLVGGLIADMECPPYTSETTKTLIQMLIQRDQAGRAKYGTTLDRTDLTHEQWLQHLIEELLDGAGYALRAKQVGTRAPLDPVDQGKIEALAGMHERYTGMKPEQISRAIYSGPAELFTSDAALNALPSTPSSTLPPAGAEVYGEIVSVDFEDSTLVFQMEPGYQVSAGRYAMTRVGPAVAEPPPIVGWLYEYPDETNEFVRRDSETPSWVEADAYARPGWDSRDALRSMSP